MPGQIVLITGCSSGFGLLTAVSAAKAGYRVVATMRDLRKRTALDEAVASAKVSVDIRPLDVDQIATFAPFVEAVEREVGPIEILVNNAGYGLGGTLHDMTLDELRSQMETNFFGAIALTKAVLPGMIARRSGLIVQVSSNSSRHPTPAMGAYSASKAALDALTESLRHEVAAFNIRVTSLQPGMYRTEIFQKRRLARAFGTESSPFHAISERAQTRMEQIVERKAADPSAVAELLVLMFSESRPPARRLVGIDARIQTLAHLLLPARAWDWLIRKALGF